jgi:hypothetical protein
MRGREARQRIRSGFASYDPWHPFNPWFPYFLCFAT